MLVDTNLVEEPTQLLRSVDEASQGFLDLTNSMKAEGFWESKPIEVTPGPPYIVNDGLTRLYAARAAGLKQVHVVITEKLSDAARLERALSSNALVVQTRPADYGKALRSLSEAHPGWTLVMLAERVHKSPEWVTQRLKVAALTGEAAALVNAGKIPLASGVALAKLQKADITITDKILKRAQQEPSANFVPDAEALLRHAKAPAIKVRPKGDIGREFTRALKDKTTAPGYVEALRWVLRQDPASAGEAVAKDLAVPFKGKPLVRGAGESVFTGRRTLFKE